MIESPEHAEERHAREDEEEEAKEGEANEDGVVETDWADERDQGRGRRSTSPPPTTKKRHPLGSSSGPRRNSSAHDSISSSDQSHPSTSTRSKPIFIHSRPSGRRRESLQRKIFHKPVRSPPPAISITRPRDARPISESTFERGRTDSSSALSVRSSSRSPSPIRFNDEPTLMSTSKPFPITGRHHRGGSQSSRRPSDASSQRIASGGGLLLNPLSHAGAEDTSSTFRAGYHPDDNVSLTPTVSFSVPERP